MLHRRDDLIDGDWPRELAQRALDVSAQLDRGLGEFAARLWPDGPADPALSRLAAISIPQASVMTYLRGLDQVPAGLEDTVERASAAALELPPR